MLLSMNWLREFVPYEGDAQKLGDALTMLGLELEDIRHPFAEISDVVVGHVVSCEKHPEADKLSVTRVDVGNEVLDIVCGAPNVAAGQKVAVAPVGAKLPGGLTIKKAKLRGAPSHGMICSEVELGLSEDHSGIMVLDPACQPGTRLVDALGLDTEVLEIGITPNRADCLSILGLARETALAFGLPLTLPQVELAEDKGNANDLMRIEIRDPDLCPVYQARILQGATNGKSPDAVRFRLQAMGMRSISALVDVTNYILLELGQPLHAFDLDLLRGGRIIVERASEGERFTTLDGQERVLCASDLTIRDAERAVALAGVMGGLDTEINDASRNVLLECAIFHPGTIRRTGRRLGLSSESAYRYERGVDQVGSTYAMNRAASLMAAFTGATVLTGIAKDEPRPWTSAVTRFRPVRCNDLLGIEVDPDFSRKTLEAVGCEVDVADPADWQVTVPSHRLDVTREADCIEEVARVYGVDKIPPSLPKICRPLEQSGVARSEFRFWQKIRNWGSGLGLNEVINYSFVGQKDLDHLGLPMDDRIAILNPLTSEQDVLRTALAPGLLVALRNNLATGITGVRLFELAHIFQADAASETTAREPARLGILMCGDRFDTDWPHSKADAGYADVRGVVEHLLALLHVQGARFVRMEEDHPWLRPGVRVTCPEGEIGIVGRVKPDIADAFHAHKDVWVAELDLDLLRRLDDASRVRFRPLPVYPASRRDITLSVPFDLPAEAVLDAIGSMRISLLEEAHLLDVYVPEGGSDRKLTYRMIFRHGKRTLEDAEVDKQRDAVADYLTKNLPVTL